MSDKKLLKNCPFCGGKLVVSNGVTAIHPMGDCFLGNTAFRMTDSWIKRWNTRVPMQKIVERLEENIVDNVDCYTGEPCNNPCVDCMNTTFYKALEIVTEEGGLCD